MAPACFCGRAILATKAPKKNGEKIDKNVVWILWGSLCSLKWNICRKNGMESRMVKGGEEGKWFSSFPPFPPQWNSFCQIPFCSINSFRSFHSSIPIPWLVSREAHRTSLVKKKWVKHIYDVILSVRKGKQSLKEQWGAFDNQWFFIIMANTIIIDLWMNKHDGYFSPSLCTVCMCVRWMHIIWLPTHMPLYVCNVYELIW